MPPPPGPPAMPGAGATSTWQPPPPSAPPMHAYAGFWQRFGALLIDGLVLTPIWAVPFFIAWNDMLREFQAAVETNGQPDLEPFLSNMIWWVIAIGLVSYAYNAVMIGIWNATLGKLALGLRVR